MACEVKSTGVTGITSAGKLQSILVYGTASGCDLVKVALDCGRGRVDDAKVDGGTWWALVPTLETDCACDKPIWVYTECAECQHRDEFILGCVPEESDCPVVVTDVAPYGECDPSGKRLITGQVIVMPATGKPAAVTVTIKSASGPTVLSLTGPLTATPYSIPFSVSLPAGANELEYKVVPGPCPKGGQKINLPPCRGCPKVERTEFLPGDCRQGKREVKVKYLVTPAGSAVSASLVHKGVILDGPTPMSASPFMVEATIPADPSDTVTIKITGAEPCDFSDPIKVDPCDGRPLPPPPPPPGGSDDDDEGGGCLIGRILVAILMATALFLALVVLCVPGAATLWWLLAATVIAAGLALALWLALCSTRCGFLLLMWQASLIAALVAAFLAGCCLAALVMAIGLGASAITFFSLWMANCRLSACKVALELLWVFAVPVGSVFAWLTGWVPCGILIVPSICAGITAALSVVAAVACAK